MSFGLPLTATWFTLLINTPGTFVNEPGTGYYFAIIKVVSNDLTLIDYHAFCAQAARWIYEMLWWSLDFVIGLVGQADHCISLP